VSLNGLANISEFLFLQAATKVLIFIRFEPSHDSLHNISSHHNSQFNLHCDTSESNAYCEDKGKMDVKK